MNDLFSHGTEALAVRGTVSAAITREISDDLRALPVATKNVRADNIRIATHDRAIVVLFEQGRVDECDPLIGLFELSRHPSTRGPLFFDPLRLRPLEERRQFSAAQTTFSFVFKCNSARLLEERSRRDERADNLLFNASLCLRQALGLGRCLQVPVAAVKKIYLRFERWYERGVPIECLASRLVVARCETTYRRPISISVTVAIGVERHVAAVEI